MSENPTVKELLDKNLHFIEKPSKMWIAKVFALAIIFCIGLYALALQLIEGHIITGMRDNVVWGVYIVNFVFVLGLSYAGALLAGIFHLGRVAWAIPLQRVLKLLTVFTLIIAPFFILLCIGRPERLFNLFIYMRVQSPIIWDVIAIVTDLIFCIVYLYFTYIKDFALLRDEATNLNLSKFRIKAYTWLALGFQNTPEQKSLLNKALDIMAIIIIPTSIIAYSLLAWLFGMNLKVGWHSSILGPFFVLSAIYSGIAALIIIIWAYRKTEKLHYFFTDGHFNTLGYSLVILSLFYSYFYLSDYITEWYNLQNTPNMLWEKYFDMAQYGWAFYGSTILVTVVPLVLIGIPWFRNVNTITISSLLILIGLWIKRYLMIVPVLETPYLPIQQDIRQDYVYYSATWVEWAMTFAGLALFILFFIIASRIAPIVPVSEMVEKEGESKFVFRYKRKKKLTTSEI